MKIVPLFLAAALGLTNAIAPLYLDSLERGTSAAAKKFVRFVRSRAGQRIISNAGIVPRLPAAPCAECGLAP